jgi:hypothetical protein
MKYSNKNKKDIKGGNQLSFTVVYSFLLEVECCKKSNYLFDLIFEKVAVRIFGTCY